MADDAELSADKTELLNDAYIANIRARANKIPVGYPGECDKCGNESLRLVGGYCAPCRDRYGYS